MICTTMEGEMKATRRKKKKVIIMSSSWWRWTTCQLDECGAGIGLYFRYIVRTSVFLAISGVIALPVLYENTMLNFENHSNVHRFDMLRGTPHHSKYNKEWTTLAMELGIVACLAYHAYTYRDHRRLKRRQIDENTITPSDYALILESPHPHLSSPSAIFNSFKDILDLDQTEKEGVYNSVVSVVLQPNQGYLLDYAAENAMAQRRLAHIKGLPTTQRDPNYNVLKETGLFQRFKWYIMWGRGEKYYTWLIAWTKMMLQEESEKINTPGQGKATRAVVLFKNPHIRDRALSLVSGGWCERMVETHPLRSTRVYRAPEPSDIMWGAPVGMRWQRLVGYCCSNLVCGLVLCLSLIILLVLQRIRMVLISKGGWNGNSSVPWVVQIVPGIFIALLNSLLPVIMKGLVLGLEYHTTHTSLQQSMMQKLVASRILNSTVVPFLATPSSLLLDRGTLSALQNILLADFAISNLVRFIDPWTTWVRYVWTLGAQSDIDKQDLLGRASWTLAERYTDSLATLSFACVFGPLIPTAYGVASLTLITAYWIDKYLLATHWAPGPKLDEGLAKRTSRFLWAVALLHCASSAWIFANWPFDTSSGIDRAKQSTSKSFVEDMFSLLSPSDKLQWNTWDWISMSSLQIGVGLILFLFFISSAIRRKGIRTIQKLVVDGGGQVKPEDIQMKDFSRGHLVEPEIGEQSVVDILAYMPKAWFEEERGGGEISSQSTYEALPESLRPQTYINSNYNE